MGGVSCESCYPPRQPHHCLLRLISEGGAWTTEDAAFYVGEAVSVKNGSGLTSPAQPAAVPPRPAASAEAPAGTITIRRKTSEPYTDHEIAWALGSGGICDQMDAAAAVAANETTRRQYRDPVSRPGETIDEIAERIGRMRNREFVRRAAVESNVGAIPGQTTEEMRFIADESPGPDGKFRRTYDVFPAGTKCLVFPGRNIPAGDPQEDDIRASVTAHHKGGRRVAVVRLGGMLRIVDEHKVNVL